MSKRCAQHVTRDGHVLLHINNVWDRQANKLHFYCTENLVHDMQQLPDLVFLGTISYDDNGRREPIFVFRKQ